MSATFVNWKPAHVDQYFTNRDLIRRVNDGQVTFEEEYQRKLAKSYQPLTGRLDTLVEQGQQGQMLQNLNNYDLKTALGEILNAIDEGTLTQSEMMEIIADIQVDTLASIKQGQISSRTGQRYLTEALDALVEAVDEGTLSQDQGRNQLLRALERIEDAVLEGTLTPQQARRVVSTMEQPAPDKPSRPAVNELQEELKRRLAVRQEPGMLLLNEAVAFWEPVFGVSKATELVKSKIDETSAFGGELTVEAINNEIYGELLEVDKKRANRVHADVFHYVPQETQILQSWEKYMSRDEATQLYDSALEDLIYIQGKPKPTKAEINETMYLLASGEVQAQKKIDDPNIDSWNKKTKAAIDFFTPFMINQSRMDATNLVNEVVDPNSPMMALQGRQASLSDIKEGVFKKLSATQQKAVKNSHPGEFGPAQSKAKTGTSRATGKKAPSNTTPSQKVQKIITKKKPKQKHARTTTIGEGIGSRNRKGKLPAYSKVDLNGSTKKMAERANLLKGSIRAGNNNVQVKQELAVLLDKLFEKKKITKEQHKKEMTKL